MLLDELPEAIRDALLNYADPEYPDEPYGAAVFGDLPEELGLYKIEEIRRWNEGDGNEMGVLFSLQDPEHPYIRRYFQVTGWYSSWGSSEWDPDTFTEMVQLEQRVTIYARKDGYK